MLNKVSSCFQNIKFDVFFDMDELVVKFSEGKLLKFSYNHALDTIDYKFTKPNINKYEQELLAQYILENYIGDILDYNELAVRQL